jgi:hypothetical protein
VRHDERVVSEQRLLTELNARIGGVSDGLGGAQSANADTIVTRRRRNSPLVFASSLEA